MGYGIPQRLDQVVSWCPECGEPAPCAYCAEEAAEREAERRQAVARWGPGLVAFVRDWLGLSVVEDAGGDRVFWETRRKTGELLGVGRTEEWACAAALSELT